MYPQARPLGKKEFADYSEDTYPVNEESRRLREESQAGTLMLEETQIITYAGRLMIGYRRGGGIYNAAEGGTFIGNDLTAIKGANHSADLKN